MSRSIQKHKMTSRSPSPQDRKKAPRISESDSGKVSMINSNNIFYNEDLVALILEYAAEDLDMLDTCALVSRVFSSVRKDPVRFDQTRTGTILFRTPIKEVPIESLRRWNQQIFTGNRTRLVAKLMSLGDISFSDHPSLALDNVRQLILQRDPSVPNPRNLDENGIPCSFTCRYFTAMTPNLDSVDVSDLFNTMTGLLNFHMFWPLGVREFRCLVPDDEEARFAFQQPDMSTLSSNNRNLNRISDRDRAAANLRELHVDPFRVYFGDEAPPIAAFCEEEWEPHFDPDDPDEFVENDFFLLQEYPNLERLTLAHARYLDRYGPDYIEVYRPMPQEALIKFVRHTPSLRWFRSDLTSENIVMLKAERPEVQFLAP